MQTIPKQNVTPTKTNALASLLLTLILKTLALFFSVNIREFEKLSLHWNELGWNARCNYYILNL